MLNWLTPDFYAASVAEFFAAVDTGDASFIALHRFPRGRNDDQVDSFSQFLNWSKGNGPWRALQREHPLQLERRERNRNWESR